MNQIIKLHRNCMLCMKPSSVDVPRSVLVKMSSGQDIQSAWPDSTPAQREIVITGTHDACFEAMTAESEASEASLFDPEAVSALGIVEPKVLEDPVTEEEDGAPGAGRDT